MTEKTSIVWFRQDLRLHDNPALLEAAQNGKILPIYILDDCAPRPFKLIEVLIKQKNCQYFFQFMLWAMACWASSWDTIYLQATKG